MTNLVTKFSRPDWFTFDFDCNMFFFFLVTIELYVHWYYFTCNFVCFWLQFSYVVLSQKKKKKNLVMLYLTGLMNVSMICVRVI